MTGPTRIAMVLGTRPEIIKLSPVIHECIDRGIPYSVIHTGQHYTVSLDEVFFDQLELPPPDHNLQVGSKSHGMQTGEMLEGIESILLEDPPDTVLVQGDTNTVLAGAIATSKLEPTLGHVEAGLRSFDRRMPEETNRVVTDHVSDYLFAPTEQSKQYLLDEGLSESKITVTGNTVVDALYRNRELAARNSSALATFDLEPGEYFLMTAHRAENVDNPERFEGILRGVAESASEHGKSVIYPIHPRAKDQLEKFGLDVPPGIRLIDPVDYLDFLRLESGAALILTDSGGVQEEACVLEVPCVTMRENTERPETVTVGANALSDCDPAKIESTVDRMIVSTRDWENPFGDGNASQRIIDELV